jgi:hypothetical protein
MDFIDCLGIMCFNQPFRPGEKSQGNDSGATHFHAEKSDIEWPREPKFLESL